MKALAALVAAAVLVLAAAIADANTSPAIHPVFYTEGARPSPGADDQEVGDPGPTGCVPWSAERQDVLVCGDVDANWSPAPAPGDYQSYPEVCEAALRLVTERSAELADRYALSNPLDVDVATCRAGGVGSADDGVWVVTFNAKSTSGDTAQLEILNFSTDHAAWARAAVLLDN